MTLISTGSTLMFSFSSHLIEALMSARWPSISRQTMPISSVTLAWRTLVMTGNLWLNCQMVGAVMSFGGYMSHKRVFCGAACALLMAGEDFLDARDFVIAVWTLFSRRRWPG